MMQQATEASPREESCRTCRYHGGADATPHCIRRERGLISTMWSDPFSGRPTCGRWEPKTEGAKP